MILFKFILVQSNFILEERKRIAVMSLQNNLYQVILNKIMGIFNLDSKHNGVISFIFTRDGTRGGGEGDSKGIAPHWRRKIVLKTAIRWLSNILQALPKIL